MALTLTNTPTQLAFAKNPIEFCFASDSAVEPATLYEAVIKIYENGTPADGDVLKITFGDGITAIFTFRDTPIAGTLELPIQPAPYSAAYFASLQAILQSHYYVNERLLVGYAPSSGGVLNIFANNPTTTISIDSIGNPVVIQSGATPASLRSGYKAMVWLCVEQDYLSGNFLPTTNYPAGFAVNTDTLQGCIGIQKLLINHLISESGLPDFPACGQANTALATSTNKRYKIKYAEQWDGQIQPFGESDIFRGLWGGVDFLSWGYDKDALLLNEILGGKFLTHKPNPAKVTCVQPETLSFIVPNDGLTTDLQLSVSITTDAGAIINEVFDQYTIHGYANVNAYEKYIIPVGVAALGLAALAGAAGVREYRVSVLNQSGTVISEIRTYQLVQHQPTTRYYLFLNSLGGIDCMATEGDRIIEVNADIETAQRTLLPSYDPVAGQFSQYCNTIVTGYKVATPFVRKCDADWFKELILRQPFAVEVRFCPDCCSCPSEASNCVYIPIHITSKKLSWNSIQAGEFQIPFEYEQDFLNDDYTPINCTPTDYPPTPECLIAVNVSVGDCVDGNVSIVVDATGSQNTSGVLEILIDGAPAFTFDPAIPFIFETGASGQLLTLLIRDIAELSCEKTVVLQLPDCNVSYPVANDDSATTSCNTPITIDVLANDLGTGLFIQSFGQGANGVVVQVGQELQYTPDSGFVGVDTFSYIVEDSGGNTATATVTVTVDGVNAGMPNTLLLCNNLATLVDLQAAVGGSVGTWAVSGSSPDTPDGGTFNAGNATFNILGHTSPVQVWFEKTVTDGLCSQTVGLVVIIAEAPDAGPTLSALFDCAILPPTMDLQSFIIPPTDQSGTWHDIDGSGQLVGSVLTLAGLTGMYEFEYQVQGVGGCAGETNSAILTITFANCNPTPCNIEFRYGFSNCDNGKVTIGMTLINLMLPPGTGLVQFETLSGGVWTDVGSPFDPALGPLIIPNLVAIGSTVDVRFYSVDDPTCQSAITAITFPNCPQGSPTKNPQIRSSDQMTILFEDTIVSFTQPSSGIVSQVGNRLIYDANSSPIATYNFEVTLFDGVSNYLLRIYVDVVDVLINSVVIGTCQANGTIAATIDFSTTGAAYKFVEVFLDNVSQGTFSKFAPAVIPLDSIERYKLPLTVAYGEAEANTLIDTPECNCATTAVASVTNESAPAASDGEIELTFFGCVMPYVLVAVRRNNCLLYHESGGEDCDAPSVAAFGQLINANVITLSGLTNTLPVGNYSIYTVTIRDANGIETTFTGIQLS